MITPPSKDRSLGTPMTPEFAQDDRRKTNKSKGQMRGFFAALRMTNEVTGSQDDERRTNNGKNNDRSRFLGCAAE
jgi:hypothetical protein